MGVPDPHVVRIEWNEFGQVVQHQLDGDEAEEDPPIANPIDHRRLPVHREDQAFVQIPTRRRMLGVRLLEYVQWYETLIGRPHVDAIHMSYGIDRGDDEEHAQRVLFIALQRMNLTWTRRRFVIGIEFETQERNVLLVATNGQGEHQTTYLHPFVNGQYRYDEIHRFRRFSVRFVRPPLQGYRWALQFSGDGRPGRFEETLAMDTGLNGLTWIGRNSEGVLISDIVLGLSFIEYVF